MKQTKAAVLDAARKWLGSKEDMLAADVGREDPIETERDFDQAEYDLTGAVYRFLGREPRLPGLASASSRGAAPVSSSLLFSDGGTSKKPFDTARNTILFLRMAASQLRNMIAGDDLPDDAKHRLRHIAEQCEAEARELADEYGIDLGRPLQ